MLDLLGNHTVGFLMMRHIHHVTGKSDSRRTDSWKDKNQSVHMQRKSLLKLHVQYAIMEAEDQRFADQTAWVRMDFL